MLRKILLPIFVIGMLIGVPVLSASVNKADDNSLDAQQASQYGYYLAEDSEVSSDIQADYFQSNDNSLDAQQASQYGYYLADDSEILYGYY